MDLKVSFDFDGTLAEEHIKRYAVELIKRGIEVWIVTSRFTTEEYIKRFHTNLHAGKLANEDLFDTAEELGIPEDRIYFTNMSSKWHFFKENQDFIWHLDDDWIENKEILNNTETKAINSWGNSSWKQKCKRILKRSN